MSGRRRLTRAQYELLENFGLRRIVPQDMSAFQVDELCKAVHAAVAIIPFKAVIGMEYMAGEIENEVLTREDAQGGAR